MIRFTSQSVRAELVEGHVLGWAKARLSLSVLVALTALSMTAIQCLAADAGSISQADLAKRIDAKDTNIVIVDVRSPEEFANGHVPSAINIPYTHMPARLSELAAAANKDIVLYCESGVRTKRAISRMQDQGFTRLLHLEGDMAKWREAKRPTAK